MNRTTARIENIFVEDGVTKACVVVGGKHLGVALTLVLDARIGDEVLIDSGFAFSVPSRRRRKNVDETRNEV